MPPTGKTISDEEFAKLFDSMGGGALSRHLGHRERWVFERRRSVERRLGVKLIGPDFRHNNPNNAAPLKEYPGRTSWEIKNGVVLVGSDLHLWPRSNSLMLRALKKFCTDLHPAGVILNGDVLDFARISSYPPMSWENTPTPQQEIEMAQDHLHDIVRASKKAKKSWTLGNHDARFERKLATVAPDFAKIHGIHLSDHFPLWEPSWSVWINESVVIKHRWKGGVHAPHNNTIYAGKTMVTGHLHSAKVSPFTDYNGTRFGVDTGCVAEPYGEQFEYIEDNPRNWVSAFGVLTFKDGKLLWPELVTPWSKTEVQFRGAIIKP